MKALFLRLFFGQNVMSRVATILAALLASFIISYLPGLPAVVTTIVGFLMELPEGEVVTQQGLVAALTPFIMWVISEIAKHLIGADNNKTLTVLKDAGVYPGPLDAWVGPVAQGGLDALVDKAAK
jgi:hypothetical protein